jgi:hypothetical protein
VAAVAVVCYRRRTGDLGALAWLRRHSRVAKSGRSALNPTNLGDSCRACGVCTELARATAARELTSIPNTSRVAADGYCGSRRDGSV